MSAYSFLDVQAAIRGPGGSFSLSGVGNAEEGISVAMGDDKSDLTVGADGQGMHSLHAGKSGTVTVRLLKTSPANEQLAALYNFQTSSSSLHGQNTVTVRDTARGDFIVAEQVAFKKMPDLNYAKSGGTNEWVFEAVFIDTTLGAGRF